MWPGPSILEVPMHGRFPAVCSGLCLGLWGPRGVCRLGWAYRAVCTAHQVAAALAVDVDTTPGCLPWHYTIMGLTNVAQRGSARAPIPESPMGHGSRLPQAAQGGATPRPGHADLLPAAKQVACTTDSANHAPLAKRKCDTASHMGNHIAVARRDCTMAPPATPTPEDPWRQPRPHTTHIDQRLRRGAPHLHVALTACQAIQ